MTLRLPARVAAAIEAHARREQPNECCGLLLGTPTEIVDLVETQNVADRPTTRYTINPEEHFAAIRRARADGVQVIGAYHSHVASPARPSATDVTEAFTGFVFLIISLAQPSGPDLTAWELRDGNFVPVSLVRTP